MFKMYCQKCKEFAVPHTIGKGEAWCKKGHKYNAEKWWIDYAMHQVSIYALKGWLRT